MSEELIMMLCELESHQLSVVLAPCRHRINEGGCIRVAVDRNCTWYRRFCARHPSSRVRANRAADTCIKRRGVVALLGRLIAGEPTSSKYADELRAIARSRAAKCSTPSLVA